MVTMFGTDKALIGQIAAKSTPWIGDSQVTWLGIETLQLDAIGGGRQAQDHRPLLFNITSADAV